MGRKLTATGTLLVASAFSAAALLSACSTSAKTPAVSASTGSYSSPATGRPATPTPSRTLTPPASPTVDIADATCGSFRAMNNTGRTAVAAQWRDAHPNSMGNPMYSSMSPSAKASYLVMTILAFCSQTGHADVPIADLSF